MMTLKRPGSSNPVQHLKSATVPSQDIMKCFGIEYILQIECSGKIGPACRSYTC